MAGFSFILLTRNPGTNRLIPITEGDGEMIAEFESESEAIEAADNTAACKAWGYEVVEVSKP